MKKTLLIVAVVLVALLIAAVVAVGMSLDKIVKKAVETAGPAVTKVDVTLEDVSLSLLNGEGSLHGFALGNPEGYESPTCIQFGLASLSLQPSSVMADKVIIRHVRLKDPVITFEGGLKRNNFSDLLDGMQDDEESAEEEDTTPEEEASEDGPSKKLQINEFALTGATLIAIVDELDGETNTFVLPDIVLTDLGTGDDGVTGQELSQLVLRAVAEKAVRAVIESDASLEKMGDAALKNLEESGNEDAANAIRGVMDAWKRSKEE
jgi:uncharacterized protein involved in outer membrane biogenesis